MASRFPLSPEAANAFVVSWYAAWNSRPNADLSAIMSHYAPGIEHSSPFIARFNGSSEPTLRGIDAVREYFGRAIERSPTPADGGPGGQLRFNPMHIALGFDSIILIYRRFSGELAAEMFVLDDAGKVTRSVSHYG